MTIEVELPDGSIAEFPDATKPEEMQQAIREMRVDPAEIASAAKQVGVDPELFGAMIQHESGGRLFAVGDHGAAHGLGQLHAGAAQDVGLDPSQRFDPQANLLGSAAYLKQQLKANKGNAREALARYNQGPNASGQALVSHGYDYADAILTKTAGGKPKAAPLLDALQRSWR